MPKPCPEPVLASGRAPGGELALELLCCCALLSSGVSLGKAVDLLCKSSPLEAHQVLVFAFHLLRTQAKCIKGGKSLQALE